MAKRAPPIEPTWRDIAEAELKIPSESPMTDILTGRSHRVYALAKGLAVRRAIEKKETSRKKRKGTKP